MCWVRGRNTNASMLNEDRIKNPVGGKAKDPRGGKGIGGCVVLLGGSHQWGSETGGYSPNHVPWC